MLKIFTDIHLSQEYTKYAQYILFSLFLYISLSKTAVYEAGIKVFYDFLSVLVLEDEIFSVRSQYDIMLLIQIPAIPNIPQYKGFCKVRHLVFTCFWRAQW
jgi:hypothetical protein